MSEPLVSIVVPTFERRDLVARAVASALGTVGVPFEVVVVDDGSTDGTAAHLRERFGGDPRLRVVEQANRGVAAARNAGAREARGRFVVWLDSDDEADARRAARHASQFEAHPEADLSLVDARFDMPAGVSLSAQPGWQPALDAASLFLGAWAPPSTMAIRRDAALAVPFDESFRHQEDMAFLFAFFAEGRRATYLPEVLATYGRVPIGAPRLSEERAEMEQAWVAIVERWHRELRRPDGRPWPLGVALSRRLAKAHVRAGRWRQARPYCLAWWRERPFTLRPLRWWLASFAYRDVAGSE